MNWVINNKKNGCLTFKSILLNKKLIRCRQSVQLPRWPDHQRQGWEDRSRQAGDQTGAALPTGRLSICQNKGRRSNVISWSFNNRNRVFRSSRRWDIWRGSRVDSEFPLDFWAGNSVVCDADLAWRAGQVQDDVLVSDNGGSTSQPGPRHGHRGRECVEVSQWWEGKSSLHLCHSEATAKSWSEHFYGQSFQISFCYFIWPESK